MNLSRIILALLITSSCSCSSIKGLARQRPVISNLRAGESVKIEYSSTSCFGGSRYDIFFVRAGNQIQASGDRISGYKETNRVPLTPILLTADDVQRLESLIHSYRTPPEANLLRFSTTQSKLSLTKSSRGKVIHRESHNDPMSNSVEGGKLLTIPALASRMPEIRNRDRGRRMLPPQ